MVAMEQWRLAAGDPTHQPDEATNDTGLGAFQQFQDAAEPGAGLPAVLPDGADPPAIPPDQHPSRPARLPPDDGHILLPATRTGSGGAICRSGAFRGKWRALGRGRV